MSAPLHWELLAMVQNERGQTVGLVSPTGAAERCGHRHASADEATMCPWTPDPWPVVCGLHVCQVRTEAPPIQAEMPWAPMSRRVHARRP